jgi:predicted Fe-S protein YdhL (DUF1289 family)
LSNDKYYVILIKYFINKQFRTDPKTGYCYGCGRNNEEKKIWKLEDTSDEWKKENIIEIKSRLNGWQLESFEESYTYKIENGISLYKKELNKK